MATIVVDSTLTCPQCGHVAHETMPVDACQFFYQCVACKTLLKPRPGDCCVFCSYGSVRCPPVQASKSCCGWPAADAPRQNGAMKTFLLFVVTALAEIVGCYLPYLWLKQGRSVWLLVPAALSLALFAWLLTLHATAAGRVYAAYGGVYVGVALAWLWAVDQVRPTPWDLAGVAVALLGMGIIMFQPVR